MYTFKLDTQLVEQRRAEVRSKLNNNLYRITQSIWQQDPHIYETVEDAFTGFVALRDAFVARKNSKIGTKFSQVYAAYISASQALSVMSVPALGTNYFSGVSESFNGSFPEVFHRLLKTFSSAIHHKSKPAPELIHDFFLWMQTQSTESSASSELSDLVKLAYASRVTVGESSYSGFSSVTNLHSTTWNQIGGYELIKQKLQQICSFIQHADILCTQYGPLSVFVPKGTLFVGPPGTGKTLLAQTLCNEAGIPFYSFDQADVGSSFVNKSATNLRELIDKASEPVAKKYVPAALIFIDEIESIAKRRDAGGSEEDAKSVTTLTVHMDGAKKVDGVFFIGATNRPDIMDPALTRPGRFSSWIEVGFPDDIALHQIYEVHQRRIVQYNPHAFGEISIDTLVAASSNSSLLKDLPQQHYMQQDFCKRGFTGVVVKDIFDRVYQSHVNRALNIGSYQPISTKDMLATIASFKEERKIGE